MTYVLRKKISRLFVSKLPGEDVMDLGHLASALFNTSVGLFVNKDRATAALLRERDIQREIENVQWQLNALARSYLLSSITFFREGVLYLFKLRNIGSAKEDCRDTEHSGAGMHNKKVEVYAESSQNLISEVSRGLNDLKLTNLNDANQRALQDAKKNFEEARKKAVDAFNNDSLATIDRIQAMVIRVAATILLNVDHPEDALEVCISCLEDLHALPEVRESFSLEINKGFKYRFNKEDRRQIITSVCRINHAIRSAAVMIAKEGELLTFPLIEGREGEKIDPLHDHIVADILLKLEMSQYSITPTAIGEKDEKRKPKIPQGITVNSQGHVIVGDEWERSVKVFDTDGFFYRRLPIEKRNTIGRIRDVATDREDNVYVLLKQEEKSGTVRFKIIMFDLKGNEKQEFLLREKTAEVLRMTVNNCNEIFVLAESFEKHTGSVVEVYKLADGQFVRIRSFGEERLNCAQDICATSDGRVIVLDRDDRCGLSVQVFHQNGQYVEDLFESVKKSEKSVTKLRSSIACHQVGNFVVIAVPSEIPKDDKKWDPVRVLKYDLNEKKLLPSIALPMKGCVSTRGVAVTVQGRIVVGLLDKSGGDSKVLVV